jgi:nicotinamide riboside kinase
MFCDQHGRTPRQNEQAHILDMQVRQEEEALAIAEQQRRAYLFCDTAPLLTAIYSDAVLGDHTLYPQARALHARYALTLHLAPDIPWVADGLQRDGMAQRARVHGLIERELAALRRARRTGQRHAGRSACQPPFTLRGPWLTHTARRRRTLGKNGTIVA